MITKLLEVTEEDIRLGKPKSADKCPIALAVKRLFPDIDWEIADLEVNGGISFYKDTIIRIYFPGDLDLEKFIESFDEGIEVNPFTREINFEKEIILYEDEDEDGWSEVDG